MLIEEIRRKGLPNFAQIDRMEHHRTHNIPFVQVLVDILLAHQPREPVSDLCSPCGPSLIEVSHAAQVRGTLAAGEAIHLLHGSKERSVMREIDTVCSCYIKLAMIA